jgi:ADP-L-glycero-D-manno-heptose 6-epimerase
LATPLHNSRIRLVVTGAAGFIGSRLLEALAARHPAEILLAVDHPLPVGQPLNFVVAPNVRFMDHQEFLKSLESNKLIPAIIFHMGACSSTTETNWAYLKDNNLVYSQRLWNWCAKHNGQLIYASSAATYGDGSQGFDDERSISQLQPLNLYGKSKQDFDLWIERQVATGRAQPQQSTGLKFFNVYGPGETNKGRMASMVFHGWNQICQQGFVRLFKSHKEGYADGGQLRDFIFVRDVVEVMLALAEQPEVSGLFNLGTGRAHTFRELIEALFTALGREPCIEYIPMPDDLKGKYQYFTEATMQKLTRAGVPYAPTLLGAAVAEYVKWLKDNPGLYVQALKY